MPNESFASSIQAESSASRQLMLVGGAVLLTALGARCEIPVQPVPFTLQTFALFTTAMLIGSRLGALSQAIYVACGAAGLGVFAGAAAGTGHVFGPTGGYLLSYIPAAFVLGRLADRGWSSSYWKTLAAMGIGASIVFAMGVAWLSRFVGAQHALISGCLLFLPSEAFKLATGAFAVNAIRSRASS